MSAENTGDEGPPCYESATTEGPKRKQARKRKLVASGVVRLVFKPKQNVYIFRRASVDMYGPIKDPVLIVIINWLNEHSGIYDMTDVHLATMGELTRAGYRVVSMDKSANISKSVTTVPYKSWVYFTRPV